MALSVVQQAVNTSSGTSTTVATFASGVTAGNAIIGIYTASFWDATHLITAPSGGGGSAWTLAAAADGITYSRAAEVWYSLNVSGGATAITGNHNSYGSHGFWVFEVSGMPTSGTVVDGTPGATGGRSNSPNPGTTTPSSGNDVILFSACRYANATLTAPTSYTLASGTTAQGRSAYRIVTSPSGAYSGTYTAGGDNYELWNAVLVAFKASGGGGGSAIKTVDGLAKASVKTVNDLAIASVKNIAGLA